MSQQTIMFQPTKRIAKIGHFSSLVNIYHDATTEKICFKATAYWSIPHNLRGSYSRATRVNAPLRREFRADFLFLGGRSKNFGHSARNGPILPVLRLPFDPIGASN
jgi:hypothetical protein